MWVKGKSDIMKGLTVSLQHPLGRPRHDYLKMTEV